MFFKIGVRQNFANFTGKKLVFESLFNKVADAQASTHSVFLRHEQNFKNTFFKRTPPVAASAHTVHT